MNVEQFATDWQAAWNARSVRAVLALCTEDVLWEDPATDGPVRGHDAVAEYLNSVWIAFPDLAFTWVSMPYEREDGTKLACPWHMTGTMLGRLDPPGFAPTGNAVALTGVDLLDLRGDKVCAYKGLFDSRAILQQAGLLPATGSKAEKAAVVGQRAARALRRRRSK